MSTIVLGVDIKEVWEWVTYGGVGGEFCMRQAHVYQHIPYYSTPQYFGNLDTNYYINHCTNAVGLPSIIAWKALKSGHAISMNASSRRRSGARVTMGSIKHNSLTYA